MPHCRMHCSQVVNPANTDKYHAAVARELALS